MPRQLEAELPLEHAIVQIQCLPIAQQVDTVQVEPVVITQRKAETERIGQVDQRRHVHRIAIDLARRLVIPAGAVEACVVLAVVRIGHCRSFRRTGPP